MSMETLTNGFYFDLALIALALIGFGAYKLYRYAGERRHRRQVEQDLAETKVVRVPIIRTHEGDWDWPSRSEHNRLLRSGQ